MLEKNYTNPEGIGRFSFSESGTFRAPYKNEGLYIVLTIMVAVFLEIGVVIFALTFMREFILSLDMRAATFSSIVATAIIGFGSIIILAVSGTIVSRISGGMDCKFSALEDKFVLNIGGDTHVIKYAEVQSVVFIPRYFLNKVKGYDVDITVANQVKHYGVSFRGQFQSEKTTPFYIIKERVEMIEQRRNDEMALYAQQKIGADKPVSQNEIDRARLRKKMSDEIFPPNMPNPYRTKPQEPEKSTPTMDSVAPRATKLKPNEVARTNDNANFSSAAMQMAEIKAVSRPKPQQNAAKPVQENTEMAEIAPLHKRPSSEIFAKDVGNELEKADNNLQISSPELSDDNKSDYLTPEGLQNSDNYEETVNADFEIDDEVKKKN